MFERYTDRARRVIVLARECARALRHGHIGTGHLLLGFLAEGECVAFKALDALGVTPGAARGAVLAIDPEGTVEQHGHIPFTPRLKRALELGLCEALELGCNYVGTEHLLLGLIREGEGIGAQALAAMGISLPDLRAKVLEILRGYEGQGEQRVQAAVSHVPDMAVIAAMLADVQARLIAVQDRLGLLGEGSGRWPTV